MTVAPFIEPLPDMDRVLDVVAKFFGLQRTWFFQGARAQERTVTRARMIFCWLAQRKLSAHPKEIGRFLHRDRSTVIVAAQKVDAALKQDERLRGYVERLRVELELEAAARP